MKFFLAAVIPSVVDVQAALGVDKVVVMFPIIVLESVLKEAQGPPVMSIPPQVEIRNGVLYINGKELDEPYVKYDCDWNLSLREVPKGKIFVLGDNRSMPIREHVGGMIDRDRLAGIPVW